MPKKTDLSVYSQADLNKISRELNERPRKTLEFKTPFEVYKQPINLSVVEVMLAANLAGRFTTTFYQRTNFIFE